MSRLAAPLFGAAAMLTPAGAAETVRAGGTGMALAFVEAIGALYTESHPEVHVQVLPSLGTPGGIKALLAKEIDVALAAARPTAEQAAQGVKASACIKTALVFATSRSEAPGITRGQLPMLFADPAPRWPDGQPLKVILRSRAGSENPYLIRVIPPMQDALAAAYQRPGIPVGATDQENTDIAMRTSGSLAITTLLQIRAERLRLLPLSLDGVEPNAHNLAAGAYPFPMEVCLLTAPHTSAAARALVDLLFSSDGRRLMATLGAIAVE